MPDQLTGLGSGGVSIHFYPVMSFKVRIGSLSCMLYPLYLSNSSDSPPGGQHGSQSPYTHLVFQALAGLKLVTQCAGDRRSK